MIVDHPWNREKVNGRSRNELVSELIYELTGQRRDRKRVSCHTKELKDFLGSRQYKFRQYEHEKLPNATFIQTTLSVSLVNNCFRIECIEYLASNIRFDFGLDRHAFQRFYSAAPADLIVLMRHARITMVEGYMPPLPDWPNLRTLQIDLWPRNPARPEVTDREWGWQTEELLAHLGVTLAVRAKITLEMRWAADCERFERKYVNKGRWRRIVVDEEDAVVGREEGFRRTNYETCGNWKTVVEGADALRGLVL